jgi:sugar phosphate isomerase/epimerase
MPDSGSIHIGNQTACYAATPTEPFEYALANGFDAFEWFPDKKPGNAGWDELDLSPGLRAELRSAAQSRGMRLSVHARWTFNPLIADAAPIVLRDIELAKDLGAAVLIIHLYPQAGMRSYAEAVLPLLRWAAASGLKVAIENTPETTPDQFNELFDELQRLAPPELQHVGMCLDLGHANLCACTRNHYLGYIDRLQAHVPIIHLHVHENWGDADSHLPLFTGPAGRDCRGVQGFLERMVQRRYSGSLILEQWPRPPSLLNEARARLLQMLSAPGTACSVSSAVAPRPSEMAPVVRAASD